MKYPKPAAADSCPSGAAARSDERQALGGLLVQKKRWGLTWRGWLSCLLFAIAMACLFLFRIHPFLAVSQRTPADFLVVEGWVHEYAIRAAAAEFRAGSYQHVFTTGGPTPGLGRYVNDAQTTASVGAGGLRNAGISEPGLQMVPSRVLGLDRTYSSAVALRNWLREHRMVVRSLNVLTEDAYARRTRLLFQRAFGKEVTVRVISVPNPGYDPKYWWRYSEGVREVLGETIAYLCARFLFHPAASEP